MSKLNLLFAVTLTFISTVGVALEAATSPLPVFGTKSGSGIFLEKSIIGENSLVDITTIRSDKAYDMALIVARVETLDGSGFCSGSRIAEDLFMTNYHCWEYGQDRVQFHMGYEKNANAADQAIFKAIEVLAKSEHFDFAIYRVERKDLNAIDFPIAVLSKQQLEMSMQLLVPGHPAARTKEIDVSNACVLSRADSFDMHDRLNIQHQCDTEGGSSGSPIMDRQTGHVIGIHWGGSGGGPSNHGIPMTAILQEVETNYPDLYSELTVLN